MESDKTDVIAVVGPTASGKTRRAVELARAFNGEIISADSRQVYRRMDIGTGKDIEEYDGVKHHLIDICEPGEKYNLYRYLTAYRQARSEIASKGHTTVLCGGSGMYVEAALNGFVMPEVPRNEPLRESLANKSLEELTAILATMKELHNVTDVDTVQRALRAIEIQDFYRLHPELEPKTSAVKEKALVIGIDIPRDQRRANITARLDKRLQEGLVEEVKSLLDEGITSDSLIYYGLEYKWVTLYVTGKVSFAQMRKELETAIHQFAKRQMTWFRGMERRGTSIKWVHYLIDTEELIDKTRQWLAG